MNAHLRSDLEGAVEGLFYPSETDAEFEVVEVSAPWPWETKGPSEVIGVRQFFGELLEGPDAASFKALWEVLAGYLDDLRVDRIGEVEVEIWVTGVERGSESECAKENRVGVKTHAVET